MYPFLWFFICAQRLMCRHLLCRVKKWDLLSQYVKRSDGMEGYSKAELERADLFLRIFPQIVGFTVFNAYLTSWMLGPVVDKFSGVGER